jgi:ABC-type bacteriocin/lantibiotic exporter with double-glycine peptidase domain
MILGVPGGTQLYDYDCGARCLHLVMKYHNVDISYSDLLLRTAGCEEYGVPINQIKSLARAYGFKARSIVNCSIQALEQSIYKRHPVIVLIQAWAHKNFSLNDWRNVGKGNRDYGHYAVVMGFESDFIILRDPNKPRQIWMTREEFLARWHGCNDRHTAIMIER